MRLNVALEASDLQIAEVVITSEDPAYPIMRKAIAKRDYYKKRTPEYSCDAYIKGFYKLSTCPKKCLGRMSATWAASSIPTVPAWCTYPNRCPNCMSGWIRRAPRKSWCPESQRQCQRIQPEPSHTDGFQPVRRTHRNRRNILSPLADNAFSYYTFRLLGRFRDENGFDVYKIEALPNTRNHPRFMGTCTLWTSGGTLLV